MSVLKFTTFGGMQPRKDIADLPNNYAEDSVGVNYYSGDLVPFKSYTPERQIPDYAKTIYPFTEEDGSRKWYISDKYLKITKHHGTANEQRIIATNQGKPLTTDIDKFPNMQFLGVPKPVETPYAILGGGGAGTPLSTVYVYTYVNDYGEESEPSGPTPAVLKKEGQLVLLRIGDEPNLQGYEIKKKRIYRSIAIDNTFNYFFLAEVPAQQTTFTDIKYNSELAEAIPSIDWNAPKDDIKNIVMLANGIYVGHTQRKIYFSEPYLPFTFPEKYSIALNVDIVSIGLLNQDSFLVGTKEKPYFVYGNSPDNMTIVEAKVGYPTIPNSMVDMGSGVMYATYQGLVYAQSSNRIRLVSQSSYSKETFEDIVSGDVYGFYNSNKYNLVCNRGTLVVDTNFPDFVSFMEEKPNCAYFDRELEELYISLNGHLVKYEDSKEYNISYKWKSKNIRSDSYINMSAYRVLADYVDDMQNFVDLITVDSVPIGGNVKGGLISLTQIDSKIKTDTPYLFVRFTRGKKLIYERFLNDSEIYRLPKDYKDDKISFEVRSNVRIREIHIGSNPFSLKKI